MKREHIVIVGSSFAGYTAALELYDRLGTDHDITVIDRKPQFLFMPSLIWYPFGLRDEEDISYDVRPAYEVRGINFIETEATEFDLEAKQVITADGVVDYDYLVVATGPKADYDYIPVYVNTRTRFWAFMRLMKPKKRGMRYWRTRVQLWWFQHRGRHVSGRRMSSSSMRVIKPASIKTSPSPM